MPRQKRSIPTVTYPRQTLPSHAQPSDFEIPVPDRMERNRLYSEARAAHVAYVDNIRREAVHGGKVGPTLSFDNWLDREVDGEHAEWGVVQGMDHLYSIMDITPARAREILREQATGRKGGARVRAAPASRRGARVPKRILATKAACRPLQVGGASSSSSQAAAAAACAAEEEGDEPTSDADWAGPSSGGEGSPVVDLTDDVDLGDPALYADDGEVTILSARSAPLARGSSAPSAGSSVRPPVAGPRSTVVAPSAAVAPSVPAPLRLERTPSSVTFRPARPRVAAAATAVAAPVGVFPRHIFGPGVQPCLVVSATPDPSAIPVNAFRPPFGPRVCPLRFGVPPARVAWFCSHALCPSRQAGLSCAASEPHYWCEHQFDLCVLCAHAFVRLEREEQPLPVVPLADAVPLVFDAQGRETVTEVEGDSTLYLPGSRRRKAGQQWLPVSICRIHHSDPVRPFLRRLRRVRRPSPPRSRLVPRCRVVSCLCVSIACCS